MDCLFLARDHPRIRGEHPIRGLLLPGNRGSSPHTRGARGYCRSNPICWRIIPAYAGSTNALVVFSLDPQDHPRIRGEHDESGGKARGWDGSSPHTRGAHVIVLWMEIGERIIPAYAGSTAQYGQCPAAARDHPRIRGEHEEAMTLEDVLEGSSPHTRGAPRRRRPRGGPGRIIPAYAGSTQPRYAPRGGEWGSSPHTRGALVPEPAKGSRMGIIPAYAGSTCPWPARSRPGADHPRIRGEHQRAYLSRARRVGSSPHTRGARRSSR